MSCVRMCSARCVLSSAMSFMTATLLVRAVDSRIEKSKTSPLRSYLHGTVSACELDGRMLHSLMMLMQPACEWVASALPSPASIEVPCLGLALEAQKWGLSWYTYFQASAGVYHTTSGWQALSYAHPSSLAQSSPQLKELEQINENFDFFWIRSHGWDSQHRDANQ